MKPSDLINSFTGSCRFLTRRLAPPLRRVPTWPTLAIALLAATNFALPVSAQDCKLTVQATPNVLKFGQTAKVDVRAHFPASAYAFASAAFDVLATDPLWTFATAGVIVGSDVLGIDVIQAHQPQLGIFADPSNPLRVWRGTFRPQSREPALVEIEVDPITFSVYPSQRTSSSAECDVEGGNDFIFVNPLRVGRWLAAPGAGTSIEIADSSVVTGRVTGLIVDPRTVGIVPTWTGPVLLDSSTTIGFDREPSSFKANVQILGAGDDVFQWDPGDGIDAVRPDARRSRIGSMTVTFDGLETGGYSAGANFLFADGSVRPVHFNVYSGQTTVASGVLNGDIAVANSDLIVWSLPKVGSRLLTLEAEVAYAGALVVDAVPQTIEASVRSGTLNLSTANTNDGSTSTGHYGIWQDNYGFTVRYDQPVVAVVRGANGQPQTVTLDRIEMHAEWERPMTWDNVRNKPLSLGCHVFEAEGVRKMWVTPSQGE